MPPFRRHAEAGLACSKTSQPSPIRSLDVQTAAGATSTAGLSCANQSPFARSSKDPTATPFLHPTLQGEGGRAQRARVGSSLRAIGACGENPTPPLADASVDPPPAGEGEVPRILERVARRAPP